MARGEKRWGWNPVVEAFRFIAAITLMQHHSDRIGGERLCDGGWIFVEFFFVLTGFFMVRHFETKDLARDECEKSAAFYTLKKLWRMAPFVVAGILIDVWALIEGGVIPEEQMGDLFAELPLHFLFLKGLGVTHYDVDPPLWYLTVVLVVLPLVTLLLLRCRHFFKYVATWLVPLLTYSVMYAMQRGIQYWGEFCFVHCLFRGLAGFLLGGLAYYLSVELSRRRPPLPLRILLTAAELGLFYAITNFALTTDCESVALPCVVFSVLVVTISFSDADVLKAHVPRLVNVLGMLSMPMYCLHYSLFELLRFRCEDLAFDERLYWGYVATFAVSAVLLVLVWALRTLIARVSGWEARRLAAEVSAPDSALSMEPVPAVDPDSTGALLQRPKRPSKARVRQLGPAWNVSGDSVMAPSAAMAVKRRKEARAASVARPREAYAARSHPRDASPRIASPSRRIGDAKATGLDLPVVDVEER